MVSESVSIGNNLKEVKKIAVLCCFIIYTKSFVIYKDRYAHGTGVISKNTAYRSVSVLVLVLVDKFSIVLGMESISKKWYWYYTPL